MVNLEGSVPFKDMMSLLCLFPWHNWIYLYLALFSKYKDDHGKSRTHNLCITVDTLYPLLSHCTDDSSVESTFLCIHTYAQKTYQYACMPNAPLCCVLVGVHTVRLWEPHQPRPHRLCHHRQALLHRHQGAVRTPTQYWNWRPSEVIDEDKMSEGRSMWLCVQVWDHLQRILRLHEGLFPRGGYSLLTGRYTYAHTHTHTSTPRNS